MRYLQFFALFNRYDRSEQSPQLLHCLRLYRPSTGIDGLAAIATQQYGGHLAEESLFLLCDTIKGAESSAIVYSLVETAKENGIDPYTYLFYALSVLPYFGKSPAHERLETLMPWDHEVQNRYGQAALRETE